MLSYLPLAPRPAHWRLWLCLAIGHLCSSISLADIPIDIWLMAGQSNMVGGGHVDHLPPGFPLVQDAVLYKHDSGSGLTDPWGPLQPRKTNNSNSSIRRWYGTELTFGHGLSQRYAPQQLGIIKYGRNGTALYSDWSPSGVTRANFFAFVDKGLDELRGLGFKPNIIGLVWIQGEGDANTLSRATAYGDRLAEFVSTVRAHYNQPKISILFNQAHVQLARAYTPQLRASQAAYAASDPLAFMINIDDLWLKPDRVHFTSETLQVLGYRFSAASQIPANIPEPSAGLLLLLATGTCSIRRSTRRF